MCDLAPNLLQHQITTSVSDKCCIVYNVHRCRLCLPLNCLPIALMQLFRWSVCVFIMVGRVVSHQACLASTAEKLHPLIIKPQTVVVLVLKYPCFCFSKKFNLRNKSFLMQSRTIKCNPRVDTLNVMSSTCGPAAG